MSRTTPHKTETYLADVYWEEPMLDKRPIRSSSSSATTFATLIAANFLPFDAFAQEALPARPPTPAASSPENEQTSCYYPPETMTVQSVFIPPIRQNPSLGRYGSYPANDMLRQVAERQLTFQDCDCASTTLHENIHFLHSHLRETHGRRPEFAQVREFRSSDGTTGTRNVVQPLWLGDGQVAMVKDPENVPISAVLPLVAESLRRSRSKEYLLKDPERYNATYLLNEHTAYLLDAEYLVKIHDHIWKTYRNEPTEHEIDAADGAAEFITYSLALAQAIESTPDSYANPSDKLQAMAVIKHLCERSADVYKIALDRERYPMFSATRRDYLTNLRESADAKPLRAFARKAFGERWFQRLVEH